MLRAFRQKILEDFPDFGSKKLFLAVSGGKDSIVLSNLLLQAGWEHELLHCNFHLRGKASDQDEQFVLAYGKKNHLKTHIEHFDTYKVAESNGKTIQETARELRYNWFKSFNINEKTLILTAHHLDDSLETFFINLLRGTGYKGVKGIPKYNPPFYRPLLEFTVDDIYKYIDQHKIDYRVDSSNRDKKYLRNRIRHEIIPSLIEIEPSLKIKMSSFFQEMIEVDQWVFKEAQKLKEKVLQKEGNNIKVNLLDLKEFSDLMLMSVFDFSNIKRSNLNAFKDFLNASVGAKFLTDDYEYLRDRDVLLIQRLTDNRHLEKIMITQIPFNYQEALTQIAMKKAEQVDFDHTNERIYFDLSKTELPLTLRKWKNGDKIRPLGMSNQKLISDILIDKKVDQFKKERTLVIVDNSGNLIAIPGLLVADNVKVDANSETIIQLTAKI